MANENGFSDGPWGVCAAHGGNCPCPNITAGPGDFVVARALLQDDDHAISNEEYQANKRLISRAPVMYRTLRHARATMYEAAKLLHFDSCPAGPFEGCDEDCEGVREEIAFIDRLLDLSTFESPT